MHVDIGGVKGLRCGCTITLNKELSYANKIFLVIDSLVSVLSILVNLRVPS